MTSKPFRHHEAEPAVHVGVRVRACRATAVAALDDTGGMYRWLGGWISSWRNEPVELQSPLPVDVARQRLRTERNSFFLQRPTADGGNTRFRVTGHVGAHRISLQADAMGGRNSWRPVLRAHLEPTGTGSRLSGTLGWHPWTKVLSAVWMAIAGISLLDVLVHAAAVMSTGDITAAGEGLLLCLIPLSLAAFLIGAMTWGARSGRAEALILRLWLADRIHSEQADEATSSPPSP
jgi:hypothetical protein